MIRKMSEELLKKLGRELEEFINHSPVERMKSEMGVIREAVAVLKEKVVTSGFTSVEEEIAFFKHVKPKFYAQLIFSAEWYSYELGRPLVKGKLMDSYYIKQLDYISRFFRQHEFMYQYYRMGADELDGMYFVRGEKPAGLVGADLPAMDATFSTIGDYLFSKFIALERLQEMVLEEMQVPSLAGTGVVRSKKGRELKWTGDSCNLIELVYGVFDCKQINGGDVDLSDLMDVFEVCFQVNLSRYFRRFTEIKRRKSISKTKFLDQMREAVNKRIDEGDAYVPMSMR
jgi:hypothetical protein